VADFMIEFSCKHKPLQEGKKMYPLESEIVVLDEYELESRFCEMLDDSYECYDIAGIRLTPSVILKNSDPIAFHLAMIDYCDSMAEDKIFVKGYTI
jgi:hypothetical protein